MKIKCINNVPAPRSLVRVFSDTVKRSAHKLVALLSVAGMLTAPIALGQETQINPADDEKPKEVVTHSPTQDSEAEFKQPSVDRIQNQPAVLADTQRLASPKSTADWLARLSEVIETRNFQVSFVQSRADGDTMPYLWRHAVMPNGIKMEQLNLQNGPGRELIRVGDVVSVFEPDVSPYSLKSEHINGPIPSTLLHHPERLKQGYEFVSVGRARVAGRPAQQIRIVSRDNNRFSYQLWLDEDTGMLLKLNMLDLQGGT